MNDSIARNTSLTAALRVVGRVVFAAIVLVTATAIGALFVAWPTQTESRSSMHMTVGARPTADNKALVQYVVEASP